MPHFVTSLCVHDNVYVSGVGGRFCLIHHATSAYYSETTSTEEDAALAVTWTPYSDLAKEQTASSSSPPAHATPNTNDNNDNNNNNDNDDNEEEEDLTASAVLATDSEAFIVVSPSGESSSYTPSPVTSAAKNPRESAALYIPLHDVVAVTRLQAAATAAGNGGEQATAGIPSLVFELKQGLFTLPPFYFRAGGVRDTFAVLASLVPLSPDPTDPSSRFLLNDTSSQLARSLDAFDLSLLAASTTAEDIEALPLTPTTSSSSSSASSSQPTAGGKDDAIDDDDELVIVDRQAATRRPGKALATGISSFFSTVSSLATVAKDTAGSLLYEARKSSVAAHQSSTDIVQDVSLSPSPAAAAPAAPPTPAAFAFLLDPSLDGPDTGERASPLSAAEFESDYAASVHSDGRLVDDMERADALRARVFAGGLEPSLRPLLWKYLLGVHSMISPAAEVAEEEAARRAEYANLKSQWTSITPAQEARNGKFRERRHRIEKDVVRTDRTHPYFAGDAQTQPHLATMSDILMSYVFYNWDLGYVQGMSDLLAPIMVIYAEDEALSFWVFEGLMRRMKSNFDKDQVGMRTQLQVLADLIGIVDPELYAHLAATDSLNLFFTFRWILCVFKREFEFDQVLSLWDVLWTDHMTTHWHLFVALAILATHRSTILANNLDFDHILKYINELSGTIALSPTLSLAHKIFLALRSHLGQQDMDALITPRVPLARPHPRPHSHPSTTIE